MKTLFAVMLVFAAVSGARAEMPFRVGGAGSDYGKGIAVDGEGNVLVTGYFQGVVDFDPAGGRAEQRAFSPPNGEANRGQVDVFLAKYTPEGRLLWVKTFTGPGADMPHTVTVHRPTGRIAIAGYCGGRLSLEAGNSRATLSGGPGRDGFVAVFDSRGGFLWADTYGDAETPPFTPESTAFEDALDVCFDEAGNVYMAGVFTGTAKFGSTTFTSREGSRDMVLASYSPTGALRWVQQLGGPGREQAHGLRVDSEGRLTVAGFFEGEFYAAASGNAGKLHSSGGWDAFVLQLDAESGAFRWAQSFGSRGNDQVRPGGLELGPDGDFWVTGDLAGPCNVVGVTPMGTRGAGADVFIARFSPDGRCRWAAVGGGPEMDFGHRVAVDGQGNATATGAFRGVARFGGSTLRCTGRDGASDIFAVRYGPDGRVLGAWSAGGGASGSENWSLGAGAAAGPEGSVYVTGRFFGAGAFPAPNGGTAVLASAGSCDVFVFRLDAGARGHGSGEF